MPRKSSAANNAKRSAYNVRQVIGDNVKARRLALGWSQQELADRFGVSRAAVSQYEIGTGEVNAGDLPRLADILGISLLEFYEGLPVDWVAPSGDVKAGPVDLMAGHGDQMAGHGGSRDRSGRGGWAAETAARLLEKHGLLAGRPPVRSPIVMWPPLKSRMGGGQAEKGQADEGGPDGSSIPVSVIGEGVGGSRREDASAGLSENQIRLAHLIRDTLRAANDGKGAGGRDGGEQAAALAVLAERFLSLTPRDQGTLSRVAEALQAGLAADNPAFGKSASGKSAKS